MGGAAGVAVMTTILHVTRNTMFFCVVHTLWVITMVLTELLLEISAKELLPSPNILESIPSKIWLGIFRSYTLSAESVFRN
jgi:hypothetical protein